MKFCYIDESGTGNESYAVMAGLVIDTYRIGTAKEEWNRLLERVSELAHRPVTEIHMRDFYSGNGAWHGSNGAERAAVIEAILNWIVERRHKVVLCGIDKAKFRATFDNNDIIRDLGNIWCALAFQTVLVLQKQNQRVEKGKGRTVVIFDNEETERQRFNRMISSPFIWSDTYYDKDRRQDRLDHILDVPYWGDSEEVGLLQVADVVAYILRRYCELQNNDPERYQNENRVIEEWTSRINDSRLCVIYPQRGRCNCAETFRSIAPDCMLQF